MILGIGTDIIEISRIKNAIARWGDNFLNHIFCEEEISYCKKYQNPAQHFAVRFAAKEAVYKAMDDESLGWKDILILNKSNGQPYCIIKKNDFSNNILISLSHSKEYAIAYATITSKE